MSQPKRTAREVVELYNLSLWNERNFDLADKLIADTMIRHEVGESHTLTREQARQRVEDIRAMFDHMRFDLNIVIDDGENVAIVYDSSMTKDGNELQIAGIEVFRVIDGKITEVWNCDYKQGVWQ